MRRLYYVVGLAGLLGSAACADDREFGEGSYDIAEEACVDPGGRPTASDPAVFGDAEPAVVSFEGTLTEGGDMHRYILWAENESTAHQLRPHIDIAVDEAEPDARATMCLFLDAEGGSGRILKCDGISYAPPVEQESTCCVVGSRLRAQVDLEDTEGAQLRLTMLHRRGPMCLGYTATVSQD